MRTTAPGHFVAIVVFASLAILFTYPLVLHVTTGVIGAGAGDNMGALWNVWWARTAFLGPEPLFWTPALFAPLGTSLALHSYAPLVSLLVSSIVPAADPLTLYNVALLSAVFLNMTCAYGAAWALTRDHLASFFAGVAFGGSPFLLVRLYGHLNVISAWGLPLLVIATLAYERRPGLLRAIVLAGTIGIVAYTDYYFAIFGVVLLLLHIALSRSSLQIQQRALTPGRRRALVGVSAVIAVAIAIVAWIETTGGVDTTVLGIRLRMTDSFNPRVGIGFLLIGALFLWKAPALSRCAASDRPSIDVWRFLPIVGTATLVLILPILIAGVQLWLAGDYESQVYFWRSAPPGIDVGALVIGNSIGRLTGGETMSLYERLGIDFTESSVWIGLAPLVLLAVAFRRRHLIPAVNSYFWIGAVFFVWSLGPYLRVFGYNTAFMLPQTFLRFVPVLANARIPGRAFSVVALMVALVGALSLASVASSTRKRAGLIAIAAVVLDFWPVAYAWTPIARPAIYETLKGLPGGVLLEIPIGMRDGFGERGRLDHMELFYQTIHGHPQTGGFVARLSSRIKTAYESDPVLRPLLDLSEGRAAQPSSSGCSESLACPVRYIVINEQAASPDLVKFVNDTFALTPIERGPGETLFSVDGLRSCSCK